MGALTEEERLYYVGQQIKSILYSVFAWEEGSFTLSFQARARKEAIKLDIHPANLIMAFTFDRLSGTLTLVVTGVGFLIHLYSVGYIDEDPGYWRYFAYLNLFIAAMLTLILGDNLVAMFVG